MMTPDLDQRVWVLENKVNSLFARMRSIELQRASTVEQQLAQAWTWGLLEDTGPPTVNACCSGMPLTLNVSTNIAIPNFTMTWNSGTSDWQGSVTWNYPGCAPILGGCAAGCPAQAGIAYAFTLSNTCLLSMTYPDDCGCSCPTIGGCTFHGHANASRTSLTCVPLNMTFSFGNSQAFPGGATFTIT